MVGDKKIRYAISILSIVGVVDSLYLTWIKLSHNQAWCIQGVGDCWSVNNSKFSEWNGIPIAILGALAYFLILAICLLETKVSFIANNGKIAVFGLVLIGVLYSAFLTYIELAILHAVCPYCALSAVVMLSLFALSVIRLVKNQSN